MSIFKILIDAGINTAAAQTLDSHYGDQPDFLDGLNEVARCLAANEKPNKLPPVAEPWRAIYDAMYHANGTGVEQSFLDAAAQYEAQVQVAIHDAVATRRREIENWLRQQGANVGKHRKTAEYAKVLKNLGYSFRWNLCTREIECNGMPMTDALASEIRCKARDANTWEVGVLEDVWTLMAVQNSYHPIREYLTGLQFSSGDPIGALAVHFTDEHGVFDLWLRRWLIGAVARVMEENVQNRVLVLDGAQGIGKDYFARWLCQKLPQYFHEGPILPDDKDCRIRRLSTWIWDVNEFGNTARRADREALKAFLSATSVRDRKPYGKYDIQGPVITSFIGTVNNEVGILSDPTGSRRFFIAHITAIDWSYATRIDVDQVWAQAMKLYTEGERWELDKDERVIANEINAQYEMVDLVEETVLKLFEITGDPNDWVATVEIMETLKNVGNLKAGTEITTQKLAAALTKLGLGRPVQRKVAGVPIRGYFGIKSKQMFP
jgi:predicted P-loop ATPase